MPTVAKRFLDSMRRVGDRLLRQADSAPAGATWYPLRQGIAMFRYLYDSSALLYPEDAPYVDESERMLNWPVVPGSV